LTTIKHIAFNICNTFNEHSGVNHFWSVEKFAEVLGKLRKFDSIDSYDFPTLHTTLPHKLIKHKFSYLIKWSFRKSGCDYICCNDYRSFCQWW